MEYTFQDLKHKKVAELREIAAGIDNEAVKGYTQLNKEHLLAAICKALNIDMYVHHQVVGLKKQNIKAHIKELKKIRDEILSQHDPVKLKHIRSQMKSAKRRLRRSTV